MARVKIINWADSPANIRRNGVNGESIINIDPEKSGIFDVSIDETFTVSIPEESGLLEIEHTQEDGGKVQITANYGELINTIEFLDIADIQLDLGDTLEITLAAAK